MGGTMAIKPLGMQAMASLKLISRRHTTYPMVRIRAIMAPQGSPTKASVLPKAPMKSPA